MARKELTFTAETGRDKGKQFFITEMPASKAESWAIKAILAVGNAGVDIPDDLASHGMSGLLAVGYMNLLKIPYEMAEPLLNEMMSCVQFIPSPSIKRYLIEDDIEEVSTRLAIRKAIWNLHVDFFLGENGSTSELESNTHPQENSFSIKPPRKR